MLQLLRPVLLNQCYMQSPSVGLLTPTLNNTYSTSSGFYSGQQSQITIPNLVGTSCPGQTRADVAQPSTAWMDALNQPTQAAPQENLCRKNVHPALSLDSFLRHSCSHHRQQKSCGPMTVNQTLSPCHSHFPQTQMNHVSQVMHSNSSPVMASHQPSSKQNEAQKSSPSFTSSRSICSPQDPDPAKDRVADLLGLMSRDYRETSPAALELVRSSSGDSQGDIIRFIDDEGTNV